MPRRTKLQSAGEVIANTDGHLQVVLPANHVSGITDAHEIRHELSRIAGYDVKLGEWSLGTETSCADILCDSVNGMSKLIARFG